MAPPTAVYASWCQTDPIFVVFNFFLEYQLRCFFSCLNIGVKGHWCEIALLTLNDLFTLIPILF